MISKLDVTQGDQGLPLLIRNLQNDMGPTVAALWLLMATLFLLENASQICQGLF